MLFVETRGNDGQRPQTVTFSEAMLAPIASFGGLYAPAQLPTLPADFLARHVTSDYVTLAQAVLTLYDLDIPTSVLHQALARYANFDDPDDPVPLHALSDRLFVSELFHGPTRAFKDMALQPFGVLLSHLAKTRKEHFLVLAATSGDTGPATLHTFRDCPWVKVVCLYPAGGTSDVQRLQMVTEDAPNLMVLGIQGDFDDAQTALKTLLGSDTFQAQLAQQNIRLSAANSVNIGRIIFQQIYHIYSYLELVRRQVIQLGDPIGLKVPSGNFGNALGAYYALRMGLPIARIRIASNQNNVLTEFIRTGRYDLRDRAVVNTNSPAMDILKSSNIERLLFDLFGPTRTLACMSALESEHYYSLDAEELAQVQQLFSADFATDTEVRTTIQDQFAQGYVLDPHTATCFSTQDPTTADIPYVICSTAEWTKFAPTMAHALTGTTDLADQPALAQVAQQTQQPISPAIADLFAKPVRHAAIIPPEAIATKILEFL